jgi:predicted RNase H-like HicB family nuclease
MDALPARRTLPILHLAGKASIRRRPVNSALGIASFHWENRMELSAVLTPALEGGYVAYNPETGTTTQGETVEEALANLREATELYLEEFPLVVTGRPLLTSFHVAEHA